MTKPYDPPPLPEVESVASRIEKAHAHFNSQTDAERWAELEKEKEDLGWWAVVLRPAVALLGIGWIRKWFIAREARLEYREDVKGEIAWAAKKEADARRKMKESGWKPKM